MMLIFWAITPLQSAIFGTQSVTLTEQVSMVDGAQLANLSQQLDAMDSSILNDAYAITWLGQPYPEFTTAQHAFLPLQPVNERESFLPGETWTTTATALSTDLDCWPAIVMPAIVNEIELTDTYIFDNGQGCSASLGLFSAARNTYNDSNPDYLVLYVGYYMEAHLDWYLQSPDCDLSASHQFLAITGRRPLLSDVVNVTGLFCEPRYMKQNVSVTISAQDRRPIESSIVALDDPQLLSETEFNATAFAYLLGTGVSPKEMRRDYPRDRVPDQYPALIETDLAWPITNLVGFAIGDMNYSLSDLGNSTALHEVFSNAHKKIFSAAFPSFLETIERSASTKAGSIQYVLYGTVVSRPIALTLEVLLILVGALVGAILALSTRTHSNLRKNPTNIGSLLEIFRESDSLLKNFASKDRYDDAGLHKSSHQDRYALACADTLGRRNLHIELLPPTTSGGPVEKVPENRVSPTASHAALRPLNGVTFVGTLLGGMAVLLYLKRQEQLLGGLSPPVGLQNAQLMGHRSSTSKREL